ncbi:MAG: chemotaxis response regulator protein-glutamate methylesterase, partial [Halothiobacillaceae bacterium]|nr:chemotaxis response regulator protein-glutamate methylesterase [Halothiobacillaceae bacterium]
AERPTPVVICSTLTEKGTQTSMQALSAGAIAVIAKPKLNVKNYLQDASSEIVSAVKAAAQARMGRINRAPLTATVPVAAAIPQAPLSASALARTTEQVVAIGTSTGGTQALEVVLSALPSVCAGIIIVQHMPEKFTAAFASRLDSLCQIEVSEAQNGDRVRAGRALIAPGGRHMVLRRSGAQYYVEVLDGPLVNRHRPSVDVMFRSVARTAGGNALGIIMTGMGDDGAQGIAEMRQTGALTLAQDEASCVVYGMPKEAVKRGGIVRSVSLDAIAAEIVQYGASGEMGHGR